MSSCHRSAFAKFRCGVAPIRLETGRYEGLPVHERVCRFCQIDVEDEMHVLLNCDIYDSIRSELLGKAVKVKYNFNLLSDEQKLTFLFSNHEMIRASAKACWLILQRRSALLYR